ncbi:MAG TPA: response regulator [Opitutales bacterium]|jgi:two-component system cell cycle sensor histidine kinase/response regulator CckA|nr:response regulator [Opitutales bacterium]
MSTTNTANTTLPHQVDAGEACGHHQPKGSLGFMAEGLAHDLNNVLAPIMTSMEVLRMRFTDEKTDHLLSLIQRQARQGIDLVQQILSLAEGAERSHACVSPQSLLRDIRKHLQIILPAGVDLEVYIAPNLWDLHGSLSDLYHALLDISLYTIKAIPAGGVLSLRVENILLDENDFSQKPLGGDTRYILFTIAHNGAPIAEELQENIFFHLPTPAGETGKSMDLFAADMIVQDHGGQIKIHNDSDTGTAFKVYLPAAPGSSADVLMEKALPRGHGECILVADDEETTLQVTKMILEICGYKVCTAVNGADALAYYLQHHDKIALVFIDMNMPFLGGVPTIHAMRRINPALKSIATSALNTPTQKGRAAAVGANYFLPKPFQSYDLLRTIDDVLHDKIPITATTTTPQHLV